MPVRSLFTAAMAALLFCLPATPAFAETRGYVIGWFATATHSTDFADNCPQNRNGGYTELLIRDLMDVGYSKPDATDIVSQHPVQLPGELRIKAMNRAVVKGKNVSVYNYPEAVTRDLETVVGKYAYGFDLSGKPSANKFEDPDTHQKIDNQLWRAVGCTDSYRAIPPTMPYPEGLPWDTLTDTSPGWSMSIEGADLTKDGDVVVTLDRLTTHLGRDANGNILSGATYIVDPASRSHNVLKGELKDGTITIGRQERIYLESEMPFYAEINLRDAQMRLTLQDNGAVVGYLGGYLKWLDFAYMHTARTANGADSIGIYHAVKKMADRYPDKSGKNQYISGTFRLVATPAYLASSNGQLIAGAALPPPGAGDAAASIASTLPPATNGASSDVPFSTPPGLTVIDVPNDAHMFGFRRIGDAEGNFLFALKPDASGNVTCAGECAKDFAPLAAPPEAAAYDVWTLVDGGGAKQWAYQGRPLYRYTGSRPIGRIVASSEDDPAVYWKVVTFRPDLSVRAPSGLKVHSLEVAAGYGLVDAETGAVTYNLSGAPKEPNDWVPVYAPGVALPTGDFTVTQRDDMTRQWTYRGRPLYTYRGDYSADDINGVFADPAASPALVVKHFMPDNVQITKARTHGPIMITKGGLTVYTEGQYRLQYGGRSTRDGYYLSYDNAKDVGTRGCVDACLKTWRPVAAPADAKSRGFWEVAARADGMRQWVYKGAALYTYADDKKLGDLSGNNRHVIVYGDAVNDSVDLTASGGAAGTNEYGRGEGSGFYWHYVMLYTQAVDRDNSKASFYQPP